jgi:hypothetical protein
VELAQLGTMRSAAVQMAAVIVSQLHFEQFLMPLNLVLTQSGALVY